MKYTRNRQIGKAMKDSSWMTMKNDKISEVKTSELDYTFKWHRDFHGMNIVSFNRKGESFKTYVIKGRK
ncbi:hypothetical protein EXW39_27925 (plasmid) [Bacillus mycoides]|uniref:hypothetical protein n=1 Tax=Bacillus mycoides TaxID=1405 RepID=UPI001C00C1EA|nr:hypothetical protein [Bacillus mycoides]QWH63933.1 hypothetical protein EXW39_27925 [Bacillus mycoides]